MTQEVLKKEFIDYEIKSLQNFGLTLQVSDYNLFIKEISIRN